MMEVVLCGKGSGQERLLPRLPMEQERLEARLREDGLTMEDTEICSARCAVGGLDNLFASAYTLEALNAVARRLQKLPVAGLRALAGLCERELDLPSEEFGGDGKPEPVLRVHVCARAEPDEEEILGLPASAEERNMLLRRLGTDGEDEVSVCFYRSRRMELDEYLWRQSEVYGEMGTLSEWNAFADVLARFREKDWAWLAAALTRKSAASLSLPELTALAARFAER